MPVVGDEWTIADPVPLWYICENDWRMFVSCNDAYEGRYDAKDWYGKTRLEECLTRPSGSSPSGGRKTPSRRRRRPCHRARRPRRRARRPRPSRRVRRRNRRRRPKRRRRRRNRRGGREQPPPPEPPAEGMDAGGAATPPPPPGAPTAGVDDAGAEDGGAGDDNGGRGGGEDVAAPPLPPAPPPPPGGRCGRAGEAGCTFTRWTREPLQRIRDARGRGGTQSSIDNRVRVSEGRAEGSARRGAGGVLRRAAGGGKAFADLGPRARYNVVPFAFGRVALTVFRTFFPVKKNLGGRVHDQARAQEKLSCREGRGGWRV